MTTRDKLDRARRSVVLLTPIGFVMFAGGAMAMRLTERLLGYIDTEE